MKYSTKFWYNTVTKESRLRKPKNILGWEYWDSKEEFSFYYQTLRPICKKFDVEIVRQHQITIAYSGRLGKITWCFDFVLFSKYSPASKPLVAIEYKGDWALNKSGEIGALRNKLALLEIHNPQLFESTCFVGSNKLQTRLKSMPCFHPSGVTFNAPTLDYWINEQLRKYA